MPRPDRSNPSRCKVEIAAAIVELHDISNGTLAAVVKIRGRQLQVAEARHFERAVGHRAIANRVGIIPPAPPEVQGQMMNIEFISMLTQAQMAAASAGIELGTNG